MPDCTPLLLHFPSFDRRKIEASFSGGNVTSDGGILLLRAADQRLGLSAALDAVLTDPRDPLLITHPQVDLLRQRIYGLALGYEDLNDHDTLRGDLAWQTALERDDALASSPTLCRLEARASRRAAIAFHEVIFARFIASFATPPAELILDFDATDDRVHGHQEGRFFNGYYGDYCFLPLYVFCGEQLLVSYLRPSNLGAAQHSLAILKLLVKGLRRAWPKVKILFPGRQRVLPLALLLLVRTPRGGLPRGPGQKRAAGSLGKTLDRASRSGLRSHARKQRFFGWLDYGAGSRDKERRVILKAEHTDKGRNPRYLVTNLEGDAQGLYEETYCARGEMENRIKEQQLGLFADRTSCSGWWANQFRLLLSGAAYVLLESIRRVALAGTELARAQVGTIRLKLLKIGAVITRNTRRIRLLLSSAYPFQALFAQVAARLSSA